MHTSFTASRSAGLGSAIMLSALLGACTAPNSYVYVANADSREVQVSRLDGKSGALTSVQQVPVAGSVMPMALSPDHRLLFASLRTAPFRVASFSIDAQSGKLSHIGDFALPDNMANIATDRTGRLLFAASYSGNKLSVSRILADGSVAPAHQVIATKPMAHSIQPTPDNRHVLATSLGGDEIMQFDLDVDAGTLKPATPAVIALPEKSGPRHLAFHPNGRFVYLIDELDSALRVFNLDTAQGTLSLVQSDTALPLGFNGKPWGADIHLTPDGRFLYSSERGSDTIGAFRVDAQSGKLTRIAHYPTETQPRGFNIDPSGRYLLAVGQKSDSLTVYAIDPVQGTLSTLARYPTGKNPNWIEMLTTP